MTSSKISWGGYSNSSTTGTFGTLGGLLKSEDKLEYLNSKLSIASSTDEILGYRQTIAYLESRVAELKLENEQLSAALYMKNKTATIEKVHFSGPVTCIIWGDNTKTIVRCSENDIYDAEKGFAMALLKKIYGNDNTFHKVFKKWVPKEDDSDASKYGLSTFEFNNFLSNILGALASAGYPSAHVVSSEKQEDGSIEVHCEYDSKED